MGDLKMNTYLPMDLRCIIITPLSSSRTLVDLILVNLLFSPSKESFPQVIVCNFSKSTILAVSKESEQRETYPQSGWFDISGRPSLQNAYSQGLGDLLITPFHSKYVILTFNTQGISMNKTSLLNDNRL